MKGGISFASQKILEKIPTVDKAVPKIQNKNVHCFVYSINWWYFFIFFRLAKNESARGGGTQHFWIQSFTTCTP